MVDIAHVTGAQYLRAHHLVDGKGNVAVAAGTEHRIHLGHLRKYIVLVALRHAAGHDDLFELALRLERRHLEDVVDGLLAGRGKKAAGVDHGHVRPLRRGDDVVSRVLHRCHHLLAVDLILGAAKGNEENLIRHRTSPICKISSNDHSS